MEPDLLQSFTKTCQCTNHYTYIFYIYILHMNLDNKVRGQTGDSLGTGDKGLLFITCLRDYAKVYCNSWRQDRSFVMLFLELHG